MELMGGVPFQRRPGGGWKPGFGKDSVLVPPGENFSDGGTSHGKDPPAGQRCLRNKEGDWDWGSGQRRLRILVCVGGDPINHSKELGLYAKHERKPMEG